MMFAKVMATAVTLGAMGGASIAVAENMSAPTPITSTQADGHIQQIANVAAATSCTDVDFRIYFEPNSARLNDDARDTISTAARDVRQCGRLNVEVAADMSRIDSSGERRLSAQRSVAVLTELRRQGVAGDVFVAPVRDVIVASEQNVGPDFVEVALAPGAGGQLLSSVTNVPTDM